MVLKTARGDLYSFHFWTGAARVEAPRDTTVCIAHPGACVFRHKNGKDIHRWPCDYENPVYTATHCSRKDEYNPNKGRVVAMTRAMKFLSLDRGTRTELWTEYFRRHPIES